MAQGGDAGRLKGPWVGEVGSESPSEGAGSSMKALMSRAGQGAHRQPHYLSGGST